MTSTCQSILLLTAAISSAQALRRITITRNELSHPPSESSREWLDAYPSTLFWPPPPPAADSPPFPPPPSITTVAPLEVPQYGAAYQNYRPIPVPEFNQFSAEEEVETTTIRYLRKVKVHPRGGKNLKQTYQRLTPVAEQPTTTEVYVTMAPIGEPEPEFTHETIMGMCTNAYSMASSFGIHNFDRNFAGSNCGLIRLYYPDATCKEIETFMTYCDKYRARA